MNYTALFLICALSASATTNRVKRPLPPIDKNLNLAKTVLNIEAAQLAEGRSNVTVSITSTNWPGLKKTATLRLRIFDGTKWSKRTFQVPSPQRAVSPKHADALVKGASQSWKVNVPLPPTTKTVAGVLQLHRPFNPIIEIK